MQDPEHYFLARVVTRFSLLHIARAVGCALKLGALAGEYGCNAQNMSIQ